MKAITNTDQLIEIVRNMLITQSELSSERVLNLTSLQGVELDKLLEEQIYESISQQDTTLLFELRSLESSNNISMEEFDNSDNAITHYKMYQLQLILYGISSSSIALKLVSRLRSSKVRSDLYSLGIYFERISEPDIINEFKNDIVWLRNDVSIELGVKYYISQISDDAVYDTINNLTIRRS